MKNQGACLITSSPILLLCQLTHKIPVSKILIVKGRELERKKDIPAASITVEVEWIIIHYSSQCKYLKYYTPYLMLLRGLINLSFVQFLLWCFRFSHQARRKKSSVGDRGGPPTKTTNKPLPTPMKHPALLFVG